MAVRKVAKAARRVEVFEEERVVEAEFAQKLPRGGEDLNTVVARIGDGDIVFCVARDVPRIIEHSHAPTTLAKLEYKRPIRFEHLDAVIVFVGDD